MSDSLKRYPEFEPVVNKLVDEFITRINDEANTVQSKMPYGPQFVLEEVIKELRKRI